MTILSIGMARGTRYAPGPRVDPGSASESSAGSPEHAASLAAAWPALDRRWYPVDDPDDWAYITRHLLFDSIRRCIAQAIGAPVRTDIAPHELHVSDDVFRHLHSCAQACAQELYALGQDGDGVVKTILAGAVAAAKPNELHPAVIRAIEQWCREARQSPA
ncbi:MAG TPA: hypothetical protein VII52_01160 [Gemmatimonadaceae bacterium]